MLKHFAKQHTLSLTLFRHYTQLGVQFGSALARIAALAGDGTPRQNRLLNRWRFLGFIILAVVLAGCAGQWHSHDRFADTEKHSSVHSEQRKSVRSEQHIYKWKMVTSWPQNFPALGTSANKLASLIEEMSGGRMHIEVYSADELVGPLEVFDAVSRGTVEMGHSGALYWKGKSAAAQLFSGMPLGLTAQEKNAWLYRGGGLELWHKLYAKFNLVPFPAGNTGVQMGGWYNREINSISDLRGLKMRMPGLGGDVLTRAGAAAVTLPGTQLFIAMETGAIDATEWAGPYNDLAFGFYRVADYYYYPGWHEPGATLELTINKDAYESLPPDLQSIVRNAARVINEDMLSEFTAKNNRALTHLMQRHQVKLRKFPQPVVNYLALLSREVLDELAAEDAEFREVYNSLLDFRAASMQWHDISEGAYMQMRKTAFDSLAAEQTEQTGPAAQEVRQVEQETGETGQAERSE